VPAYVEYELDEGVTILIEAPEDETEGIVQSSRGEGPVVRAKKKFREALDEVKLQAKILVEEIEELHVDEAEVKFGLTAIGEAGNMAIGKVGLDVNYEITLTWKKPSVSA
jgi:hypothetical protein